MKTRAVAALVPAVLVALVAVAAPAYAKGAQDATVKGPGLEHAVRLRDDGFQRLLASAGLYASVFHQPGSAVSATRPAGRLGPRYTVTYGWLVAQDETEPIRQFVYPFASGGALAFTPPRQRVGSMTESLDGGWYRGGPQLRALVVSLGVPDHTLPTT
jgi:hypothetical protein